MTGISRSRIGRASWIAVAAAFACGGRAPTAGANGTTPAMVRLTPAAEAIVLETAGAPPADTTVSFTTGVQHTIVLRHGPPENIDFAELTFPPTAFADSGRQVTVDVKPRPGIYGVDIHSSLAFRGSALLTFKYGRYFLAPSRSRAVYGDDVQFERALAVAQVLPDGRLALLPSTRPASDNLEAAITSGGTYLVAAPQ